MHTIMTAKGLCGLSRIRYRRSWWAGGYNLSALQERLRGDGSRSLPIGAIAEQAQICCSSKNSPSWRIASCTSDWGSGKLSSYTVNLPPSPHKRSSVAFTSSIKC